MQDVVVFQIAGLLGLLGMGLTWTGVLSRYMGFYDLSLVWNHVLWGMALGALVAVLEFDSLFLPYYDAVLEGTGAAQGPSIVLLAWWVSMHSAVVHLFLLASALNDALRQRPMIESKTKREEGTIDDSISEAIPSANAYTHSMRKVQHTPD